MDFGANDLIKLWQMQDNFEAWAQKLTESGVSLGAMVLSVELAKRMLDPTPLNPSELEEIRNRSIQIALQEVRRRLNDAGKPKATEE